MKDTELKGCLYNPYTNPYCPIFRLGDIVNEAKENFASMAVEVKPVSPSVSAMLQCLPDEAHWINTLYYTIPGLMYVI